MSRKSSLSTLILLLVSISLLVALAPVSDFDQDGNWDSLVTEGFILIPLIGSVTGFFLLWIRLPITCLAVSKLFSSLIVPPPIPTE